MLPGFLHPSSVPEPRPDVRTDGRSRPGLNIAISFLVGGDVSTRTASAVPAVQARTLDNAVHGSTMDRSGRQGARTAVCRAGSVGRPRHGRRWLPGDRHPGDERQGAELASAVRRITRDPWTVVITHSHFDHSFGTRAFLECPVWAHEGCRTDLIENGETTQEAWRLRYLAEGQAGIADDIAKTEIVLPDHLRDRPGGADRGRAQCRPDPLRSRPFQQRPGGPRAGRRCGVRRRPGGERRPTGVRGRLSRSNGPRRSTACSGSPVTARGAGARRPGGPRFRRHPARRDRRARGAV